MTHKLTINGLQLKFKGYRIIPMDQYDTPNIMFKNLGKKNVVITYFTRALPELIEMDDEEEERLPP